MKSSYFMLVAATTIGTLAFGQEPSADDISSANQTSEQPAAKKSHKPEAPKDTAGVVPIPESATLPERVVRFRAVYGTATGDSGYDKDGKKVDSPVKVDAARGAAVLEYGITPRLSMQLLVPYTLKQDFSANDDAFNDAFDAGFDREFQNSTGQSVAELPTATAAAIVQGTAQQLAAAGQCGGDVDACKAAIEAGQITAEAIGGIDFSAVAEASGNEGLQQLVANLQPEDITSGAISTEAIAARFSDAITRVREIQREEQEKNVEDLNNDGLGDIEVGLKYAYSSVKAPLFQGVPLFASIGLGLRFNTSDFAEDRKKGRQPVGRGTTDLGIRNNIDFHPVNGVGIALENQTELQVMQGETYTLNLDDESFEKVDFSRHGIRNVGYLRLALAFGAWYTPLEFLTVSGQFSYDYDAEQRTDGERTQARSELQSIGGLVKFSGFPYGVPLELEMESRQPLEGKNVAIASDVFVTTLKAYCKI